MVDNNLEIIDNRVFENIKHIDEEGNEYWLARELQVVLEYSQWRRFESVISEAMIVCKKSNNNVYDHFANVGKMIEIAKGGKRKITKIMSIFR